MQLEDNFEQDGPLEIRLKGHRIGIDRILFDYKDGLTPEEIALRYPTVSLEEIYATITYYWRNRDALDEFLRAIEDHEARLWREQEANPHLAVKRLRELAAARGALAMTEPTATTP